jgi:uncharacterized protein (TIRG00374 family)
MDSLKKITGVIILALFVAWAGYFAWQNWDTLAQISIVRAPILAVLLLLFALGYFLIGYTTKILLEPLGVRIGYLESFGIAITTGFYNILTPFRGGMATKGYYLKTKHGLTYTDFFTNLSADYIFAYWIGSILGIGSMYSIYLTNGVFNWVIFGAFLGVFLTLTYIMVFAPHYSESKYPWLNRFIGVINGWHAIRAERKTILKITIISIVKIIISSITIGLYFRLIGMDVSFQEGLFISVTSSFAKLVAITPAGLGINEAFLVFSAQVINIPTAESLAVAILTRTVLLIGLLCTGPIASYFLFKKVIFKEDE